MKGLRVSLEVVIRNVDDRVGADRVKARLVKAARSFAQFDIEDAVDYETADDSTADLSKADFDTLVLKVDEVAP